MVLGRRVFAALMVLSICAIACSRQQAPGSPSSTAQTAGESGAADGSTLKVKRQTESGYDMVEASLPAVVSVTAGVNEPRYPSLKGIMGAKSKPLDKLTAADLELGDAGGATAGQTITAVEPAPERAAGEVIRDEGDAAKRVADFLAERKVI